LFLTEKHLLLLVYINAIRLPKRSEVKQTQVGKMATTSGWGRISPSNLIDDDE
jgi:hypothetical protein